MATTILALPETLRGELKAPMGPVYADPDELLATADVAAGGGPLVAVGDVVTAHLLEAGHVPAVALIDERTEREAVDDAVASVLAAAREGTFSHVVDVDNPPATLTDDLFAALAAAIERAPETTMIVVDGEEDLAALPAIVALPDGGSVVYGQPGEGMVLVEANEGIQKQVQELLSRMDGDVEDAMTLLSS